MQRPAYERDPYLTQLNTTVEERGDDGRSFVVLADTVFYPEGGGQPSDRGAIHGIAVTDVQRVEGALRHYVAESVDPDDVRIEIDWARRFDHMQQHTGQHMLTALAEERFGWATQAFHLGDVVSDIELDTPAIEQEQLHELEEALADEIRRVRPVRVSYVEVEQYREMEVRSRGLPSHHTGDVRLVEIEDIDLNSCGGTHVGSTAELESMKLLRTESLRGGTRLFYVAGGRVRTIFQDHFERTAALRGILGVSDAEIVDATASKLSQLKDAHRKLRQTEGAYAEVLGTTLAAERPPLIHEHWPDRELGFLQQVARSVCGASPATTCFFTAGEKDGSFLVAIGSDGTLDLSSVGPEVAELLAGKGGGRGDVFQGR
ncbi:MAG: alanyl-tRNA editing protein, partial [Gemmatimonadota bacterium]